MFREAAVGEMLPNDWSSEIEADFVRRGGKRK